MELPRKPHEIECFSCDYLKFKKNGKLIYKMFFDVYAAMCRMRNSANSGHRTFLTVFFFGSFNTVNGGFFRPSSVGTSVLNSLKQNIESN